MNDWISTLLNSDYGPAFLGGTNTILFILLLTFAIGHFIGYVYMWTHEAISYSRTFVVSLAVLPALIAVMMIVMAGNLLIAFGLIGVFGVIRFRNVLKDTRDTAFIPWAVLEGVGVGTLRFSTAILATGVMAAALLYLRLTSFGTRQRFDAVVTLRLAGDRAIAGASLRQVLRRHAWRSTVVTERRVNDGGVDLSYQLLLRDPSRCEELQNTLAQTEGLTNVAVFMHNDEAEI